MVPEFVSPEQAFNAGGNDLVESLKPIKESVSSLLQLHLVHKEPKNQSLAETENVSEVHDDNLEQSSGSDKYPAPATPQLKHGGRLLDDGDFQDQTNCPTEKDSVEQDGESKSVETTCGNSVAKFSSQVGPPQRSNEAVVKEEDDCGDGSKSESNISKHPRLKKSLSSTGGDSRNQNTATDIHNSCGTRSSRKKMKVMWLIRVINIFEVLNCA